MCFYIHFYICTYLFRITTCLTRVNETTVLVLGVDFYREPVLCWFAYIPVMAAASFYALKAFEARGLQCQALC